MMTDIIQTSYEALLANLTLINGMEVTSVKKLNFLSSSAKSALAEIKEIILGDPFADLQEEIAFFKYDKPQFVSEILYAREIYSIEKEKPLGGGMLIKNFYDQELRFIKRFFNQHQFLYQYYQLEASDLDRLFFVRRAKPSDVLLSEPDEYDPVFSTAADHLFAKFMAYEKVQDYLMEKSYGQGRIATPFVSKKGRPLEWTGDKSNLIELAYAIYDTMQLNNGNVDISDIIDWLEQSLQVNLGRYYKRFSEIRMRKNVSRTRYLDFMVEMILKHMDEGDAFQPRSLKPVSGSKSRI